MRNGYTKGLVSYGGDRRIFSLRATPFEFLDENTGAIFGRSYAVERDILVEQLRNDEAIAEADTLLLTIPNQLGVAYDAHVMEAILTTVAPALGWALNRRHIHLRQLPEICR